MFNVQPYIKRPPEKANGFLLLLNNLSNKDIAAFLEAGKCNKSKVRNVSSDPKIQKNKHIKTQEACNF